MTLGCFIIEIENIRWSYFPTTLGVPNEPLLQKQIELHLTNYQ